MTDNKKSVSKLKNLISIENNFQKNNSKIVSMGVHIKATRKTRNKTFHEKTFPEKNVPKIVSMVVHRRDIIR